METALHRLKFAVLTCGRAYAQAHALREKAVCCVVRDGELLVFDHVPDNGSGVQVVAGGLEPGEAPEAAALREAHEETGRGGFRVLAYLGSAVWLDTEHAKRELRHFFHLAAPTGLPDTWEHAADGHVFRFRWAPLGAPGLDWEMDAALPELRHRERKETPDAPEPQPHHIPRSQP